MIQNYTKKCLIMQKKRAMDFEQNKIILEWESLYKKLCYNNK